MRRFWSFYQNESYQVGCSGRTVYIYDKAGNELAKFRDIPLCVYSRFYAGKEYHRREVHRRAPGVL